MHWRFFKASFKVFPLRTVIILFCFHTVSRFFHICKKLYCVCTLLEIYLKLFPWILGNGRDHVVLRVLKFVLNYTLHIGYTMQCPVLDISVLGIDFENFLYANILVTDRYHVALRFFFFFTFAINYIPCKSYHVNISLEVARVYFHSRN